MYEIIIGRNDAEQRQFGKRATVFLGKQYIQMERTTSLSNEIYLDAAKPHVVFVCGKRGSGKSYTLGVVAEGLVTLEEEFSKNVSVIMLDTMGVFWTMKYPNTEDILLLRDWKLEPRGFDVKIYVPEGFFQELKDKGVPVDSSFSVKPSDLNAFEWCETFQIPLTDPVGVLIERVISTLKEEYEEYTMKDIIEAVHKVSGFSKEVKEAAENRFMATKAWGLFSEKGIPLTELVQPGKITVLDMSCYAAIPGSTELRALVIGMVCQKVFTQRMLARRDEEFTEVKKSVSLFAKKEEKEEVPLVWIVLDEAHEFLPLKGKTLASDPLIRLLREGRQPGISLVLASQQPGQIHTDVITQADTVISHRLTALIDVKALGALMQSYMREGLDLSLQNLPRVDGAGIIFDDKNERLYPMRIRPRITWHGGSSPALLREKKKSAFE